FLLSAAAPTEISTLSLHDALPIWDGQGPAIQLPAGRQRQGVHAHEGGRNHVAGQASAEKAAERIRGRGGWSVGDPVGDYALLARSEEHTSELQSRSDLVCRLLLEK